MKFLLSRSLFLCLILAILAVAENTAAPTVFPTRRPTLYPTLEDALSLSLSLSLSSMQHVSELRPSASPTVIPSSHTQSIQLSVSQSVAQSVVLSNAGSSGSFSNSVSTSMHLQPSLSEHIHSISIMPSLSGSMPSLTGLSTYDFSVVSNSLHITSVVQSVPMSSSLSMPMSLSAATSIQSQSVTSSTSTQSQSTSSSISTRLSVDLSMSLQSQSASMISSMSGVSSLPGISNILSQMSQSVPISSSSMASMGSSASHSLSSGSSAPVMTSISMSALSSPSSQQSSMQLSSEQSVSNMLSTDRSHSAAGSVSAPISVLPSMSLLSASRSNSASHSLSTSGGIFSSAPISLRSMHSSRVSEPTSGGSFSGTPFSMISQRSQSIGSGMSGSSLSHGSLSHGSVSTSQSTSMPVIIPIYINPDCNEPIEGFFSIPFTEVHTKQCVSFPGGDSINSFELTYMSHDDSNNGLIDLQAVIEIPGVLRKIRVGKFQPFMMSSDETFVMWDVAETVTGLEYRKVMLLEHLSAVDLNGIGSYRVCLETVAPDATMNLKAFTYEGRLELQDTLYRCSVPTISPSIRPPTSSLSLSHVVNSLSMLSTPSSLSIAPPPTINSLSMLSTPSSLSIAPPPTTPVSLSQTLYSVSMPDLSNIGSSGASVSNSQSTSSGSSGSRSAQSLPVDNIPLNVAHDCEQPVEATFKTIFKGENSQCVEFPSDSIDAIELTYRTETSDTIVDLQVLVDIPDYDRVVRIGSAQLSVVPQNEVFIQWKISETLMGLRYRKALLSEHLPQLSLLGSGSYKVCIATAIRDWNAETSRMIFDGRLELPNTDYKCGLSAAPTVSPSLQPPLSMEHSFMLSMSNPIFSEQSVHSASAASQSSSLSSEQSTGSHSLSLSSSTHRQLHVVPECDEPVEAYFTAVSRTNEDSICVEFPAGDSVNTVAISYRTEQSDDDVDLQITLAIPGQNSVIRLGRYEPFMKPSNQIFVPWEVSENVMGLRHRRVSLGSLQGLGIYRMCLVSSFINMDIASKRIIFDGRVELPDTLYKCSLPQPTSVPTTTPVINSLSMKSGMVSTGSSLPISTPVHSHGFSLPPMSLDMSTSHSISHSGIHSASLSAPVSIPHLSGLPTSMLGTPTVSPTINDAPLTAQEIYLKSGLISPYVTAGKAYAMDRHVTATQFVDSSNHSAYQFTRRFTGLFDNSISDQLSFGLDIGDHSFTSSETANLCQNIPNIFVTLVANSQRLYVDNRHIVVYYQLKATNGSLSRTNPVSVKLYAAGATGGQSASSQSCSYTASAGIGQCGIDIPQQWFTTNSENSLSLFVDVSFGAATYSSNTVNIVTYPVAQYLDAAPVPSMTLTVPQRAFFKGDTVSLTVTADTDVHALTAWVINIRYDPTALQFGNTVSTSSSYIAAVVSESPSSTTGSRTRKIAISTSGLNTGVSEATVMGSVAICTVSFTVLADSVDAFTIYSDVVDLFVSDMINVFSIKFLSNTLGNVRDTRSTASGGESYKTGQIIVAKNDVVEIFSYISRFDIINMQPITANTNDNMPIVYVSAVRSNGQLESISNTAVACSTATNSKLIVSPNCAISFTYVNTLGGNERIAVAYGGRNSFVDVRVWHPISVIAEIDDAELNRITPSSTTEVATCPDTQYQRSRVYAKAEFVAEANMEHKTMYVTSKVFLWKVSDTAAASINAALASQDIVYLEGKAPGMVEIGVTNYGTGVATPTISVRVSNQPVYVSSMALIAYSSVEGSSLPCADPYSTVTPSLSVHSLLKTEGATAYVSAFAKYSDGQVNDITNVISNYGNMRADVLSVVRNSNQQPVVTVIAGSPSYNGIAINGSYHVCGQNIIGYGSVNVELPNVERITATVSSSRITAASDAAHSSPFNIPSQVLLSVTVYYADSTSKTVSSSGFVDSRVTFSIANGNTAVYRMNGNLLEVFTSLNKDEVLSNVQIVVGFAGSSAVATVNVQPVAFHHSVITTSAYPTCTQPNTGCNKDTIHQLICSEDTSVYERLLLTVTGYLTDSTVNRDITSIASISTNTSTINDIISNSGKKYVYGLSAGNGVVSATLTSSGKAVSAWKTIHVINDVNAITTMQIATTSGTNTVVGTAGSFQQLKISLTFADQTYISDAVSLISTTRDGPLGPNWLSSLAQLIELQSSYDTALSVNSAGTVQLNSNYFQSVTITGVSLCNMAVSTTQNFYANLQPETYDVDVGSQTGAPFGIVTKGTTKTLSVRIQGSNAYDITAFQILLQFDPTVVRVSSDSNCAKGSSWSASWDCTTNDPVNQVLIAGACGLLPSSQCSSKGLIEIATLTVTAMEVGSTAISGSIIKLQDSSGNVISNIAIVAGSDDLVVITSTSSNRHTRFLSNKAFGRSHTSSKYSNSVTSKVPLADGTASVQSIQQILPDVSPNSRSRILATPSACIAGDNNGDGALDVLDVINLQHYIGGSINTSSYSTCQQVGFDADRNGVIDGVDIQYLLRVVTKKYKILRYLNTTVSHSGDFNVEASIYSGDNDANFDPSSFSIQYQIRNDKLAKGYIIVKGTDSVAIDNSTIGVNGEYLFTTVPTYTVAGHLADLESSGTGVVMSVSSYDSLHTTSSSRQFIYFCSPTLSSCVAVYGQNAFKPYLVTSSSVAAPTIATTSVPTSTLSPSAVSVSPVAQPLTIAPTAVPATSTPTTGSPTTRLPTAELLTTSVPSAGVGSVHPNGYPTGAPSTLPTSLPTGEPTLKPSPASPTVQPTAAPTTHPSQFPTTVVPSVVPTVIPTTTTPSKQPTEAPSAAPTTIVPTEVPSVFPTTSMPTAGPSVAPSTVTPTPVPTESPTTTQPTVEPSPVPSTTVPTAEPSFKPTKSPSATPTKKPTMSPSAVPTAGPTFSPSDAPTVAPSTAVPTTAVPTQAPVTRRPTNVGETETPTVQPTQRPTHAPSVSPTHFPTGQPTGQPTSMPSVSVEGDRTALLKGLITNTTEALVADAIARGSTSNTVVYFAENVFNSKSYKYGDCSSWNTLGMSDIPSLTSTQVASMITMVTGIHSDFDFSNNRRTDLMDISSASCYGQTPTKNIVNAYTTLTVAGSSFSTDCFDDFIGDNRTWIVKNCNAKIAICVDCSDPCADAMTCSSTSSDISHVDAGVHVIYPCATCSTGSLHRRDAVRVLAIDFQPIVPAPSIHSILTSQTNASITITGSMSATGTFYCGKFTGSGSSVTTATIQLQNYATKIVSGSLTASITMTNLQPSTVYTLYCYTTSPTGTLLSTSDMLATRKVVTTDCCKTLTVSLTTSRIYAGGVSVPSLLSLSINAPPAAGTMLVVTLSTSFTSEENTVTPRSPFLPINVTFTESSSISSKFSVGYVSADTPGTGLIVTNLALYNATDNSRLSNSFIDYNVSYDKGTTITVIATNAKLPAPTIVSARFTSDGSKVTISLDSPGNKAGKSSQKFNCKDLLTYYHSENNFVPDSSSSTSCQWSDDGASLVVYVGAQDSHLLAIGDIISLRNNTSLKAACSISNKLECALWPTAVGQNVTLAAPLNAVSPKVAIATASNIGSCTDITLDITSSSGNGGRKWHSLDFSVSYYPSDTSIDAAAVVAAVEQYLATSYTVDNLSPPPAIPASLLSTGSYGFTVELCNYLTKCSQATANVAVLNSVIPVVTVLGSSQRTILRATSLSIASNSYTMDCATGASSSANITKVWTISTVNTNTNARTIASGIKTDESKDTSLFTLQSNTLTVGVLYELTVTATYRISGLSAKTTVQIYVESGALNALISGGSTRSVNVNGQLEIDGSISYDADDNVLKGNTAGLVYSWTCTQQAPVLLSTCPLQVLNANGLSSTLDKLTVKAAESESAIGSSSLITMTITSSKDTTGTVRSSTTSVLVNVNSVTAPSVNIISNAITSFAVTNVLTIKATVTTILAGRAYWTVDDDSITLASPTTLTASDVSVNAATTRSVNLKLSKGVLSERSTYTFTLRCYHSVAPENVTTAALTVTTAGPPLPGIFTVTPDNGTELTTNFVFSTASWTADSLPLTYEFGTRTTSNGVTLYNPFKSSSEVAFTSSVLGGGLASSNYTVKAYVKATDASGASSYLMKDLVVRPSANLLGLIGASLTSSADSTQTDTTKAILSCASNALNSAVNCSLITTDYCASLNRNPCSTTANTCGLCLAGYPTGESRDSNTKCYAATTTTVVNTDGNCTTDTDCTLWYKCGADSKCFRPSKSCNAECLVHGVCTYQNIATSASVNTCSEGETSCRTVCVCGDGYTGTNCDVTAEKLAELQGVRELLMTNLMKLTQAESPSVDTVTNWASYLGSLTSAPSELTSSSVDTAVSLSLSVLSQVDTYGADFDITTSTIGANILNTINNIIQATLSTASGGRRRLTDSQQQTLAQTSSIIQQYTALVMSNMIEGQDDITQFQSSYVIVASVSSGSADSAAHLTTYSLETPLTSLQQQQNVQPYRYSLQYDGSSTNTVNQLMKFSLVQRYLIDFYGSSDSITQLGYHTNPVTMYVQDAATLCQSGNQQYCSISVQLVNNADETYQQDTTPQSFTTTCRGGTIISANYPHISLNATHVTYNCSNGTPIINSCNTPALLAVDGSITANITQTCPVTTTAPQCLPIDSSSGDPFADASAITCATESFNPVATNCSCSLDFAASGSTARRRLQTGSGDSILNSDGTAVLTLLSRTTPSTTPAVFSPLAIVSTQSPTAAPTTSTPTQTPTTAAPTVEPVKHDILNDNKYYFVAGGCALVAFAAVTVYYVVYHERVVNKKDAAPPADSTTKRQRRKGEKEVVDGEPTVVLLDVEAGAKAIPIGAPVSAAVRDVEKDFEIPLNHVLLQRSIRELEVRNQELRACLQLPMRQVGEHLKKLLAMNSAILSNHTNDEIGESIKKNAPLSTGGLYTFLSLKQMRKLYEYMDLLEADNTKLEARVSGLDSPGSSSAAKTSSNKHKDTGIPTETLLSGIEIVDVTDTLADGAELDEETFTYSSMSGRIVSGTNRAIRHGTTTSTNDADTVSYYDIYALSTKPAAKDNDNASVMSSSTVRTGYTNTVKNLLFNSPTQPSSSSASVTPSISQKKESQSSGIIRPKRSPPPMPTEGMLQGENMGYDSVYDMSPTVRHEHKVVMHNNPLFGAGTRLDAQSLGMQLGVDDEEEVSTVSTVRTNAISKSASRSALNIRAASNGNLGGSAPSSPGKLKSTPLVAMSDRSPLTGSGKSDKNLGSPSPDVSHTQALSSPRQQLQPILGSSQRLLSPPLQRTGSSLTAGMTEESAPAAALPNRWKKLIEQRAVSMKFASTLLQDAESSDSSNTNSNIPTALSSSPLVARMGSSASGYSSSGVLSPVDLESGLNNVTTMVNNARRQASSHSVTFSDTAPPAASSVTTTQPSGNAVAQNAALQSMPSVTNAAGAGRPRLQVTRQLSMLKNVAPQAASPMSSHTASHSNNSEGYVVVSSPEQRNHSPDYLTEGSSSGTLVSRQQSQSPTSPPKADSDNNSPTSGRLRKQPSYMRPTQTAVTRYNSTASKFQNNNTDNTRESGDV